MTRLKITEASVERSFHLVPFVAEDGPAQTYIPGVAARSEDGRDWFFSLVVWRCHPEEGYHYPTSRMDNDALEALVARVLLVGIDPEHWTEILPYDRELEEQIAWQEEQEDRRSWGA